MKEGSDKIVRYTIIFVLLMIPFASQASQWHSLMCDTRMTGNINEHQQWHFYLNEDKQLLLTSGKINTKASFSRQHIDATIHLSSNFRMNLKINRSNYKINLMIHIQGAPKLRHTGKAAVLSLVKDNNEHCCRGN